MTKHFVFKTILSVAATCTLASAVTDFKANVCDSAFVASKAGDKDWVIIDGRPAVQYKEGHIPGAVNYGQAIVVTLKHPVDGKIVSAPVAADLLGKMGVDNKKGVIVYGTRADYHVAVEMSPWYYGVKEYCYLDGGFETWKDLGKPVETKVNEPRPAKFEAKIVHPELYISTNELIQVVNSKKPNVTLIDVRSKAEFEGTENTLVRGGRIPGAIHMAHDLPINAKDGTFKSLEQLKAIYKDIPKNNEVIVYCHRGCRTSYTYSSLKMLGYSNVKIYEDSMIVWGARADTPIEEEHNVNLRAYKGQIDTLNKEVKELKELIKKGVQPAGAAPSAKEAAPQIQGC